MLDQPSLFAGASFWQIAIGSVVSQSFSKFELLNRVHPLCELLNRVHPLCELLNRVPQSLDCLTASPQSFTQTFGSGGIPRHCMRSQERLDLLLAQELPAGLGILIRCKKSADIELLSSDSDRPKGP
jgi:hypothetical protein